MFDRFVWSHVLAYEYKQRLLEFTRLPVCNLPIQPDKAQAILSIEHACGHVKCDTRTLGDDLLRVPSSSIQIAKIT